MIPFTKKTGNDISGIVLCIAYPNIPTITIKCAAGSSTAHRYPSRHFPKRVLISLINSALITACCTSKPLLAIQPLSITLFLARYRPWLIATSSLIENDLYPGEMFNAGGHKYIKYLLIYFSYCRGPKHHSIEHFRRHLCLAILYSISDCFVAHQV